MSRMRSEEDSSWVGKGAMGSPFPQGVKMKEDGRVEGAGTTEDYVDTSEGILKSQQMTVEKLKKFKQKEYYKN